MLDRTFAYMGSAKQHLDPGAASGVPDLHLVFPGDPPSVRRALETAMAVFHRMALGAERDGAVEIVLAEALNNVVEHAYAGIDRGVVELEACRRPGALVFRIRDDGRPMPDGAMPDGGAHDLDVGTDALPEGGFGWFLIRELTEDLSYRRNGESNELTFRVRLDPRETGA